MRIEHNAIVRSQSLKVLNHLSEVRTFALSDVDWNREVSRSLPWMPEVLMPAGYLPSFQELTDFQKLRFNQLTAQAVCEQFIWFEEDLICPILRNVLKARTLNPELRRCLENFIEEEGRHSEMFLRLLKKIDPLTYQSKKYHLFGLRKSEALAFQQLIRRPNFFLVWIWMAIYFEERTLHFSKAYQSAKELNPSGIDPLFSRVHALHMIDEARHLQIDQYLLREFYVEESKLKRGLAAAFTKKILSAYRSPQRNSRRIIQILSSEAPGPVWNQLEKELPSLRSNTAFQKAMFGSNALGRTRELMNLFPEMRTALAVLD